MASYTNKLNLKKPGTGEKYDVVSVYNDAMDKIDNHAAAIDADLATRSRQVDLDNLSDSFEARLATKVTNGQARANTSTLPINVSEMDTATKALFTGGTVAVVGPDAVGWENIKNKAVGVNALDDILNQILGIESSGLSWQIGSPEAGIVKPNRTHAVTSVELLDISQRGVNVYVKPGIGLLWWIAYYDAAGTYTGESDYLTDPVVKLRPNTKIRITFTYSDMRVLGNKNDILWNVSVNRLMSKVDSNDVANMQIPSYWQSHLASKINTIIALQNAGGADCTSIGFITDTHVSANNQKSGALMDKIVKDCDIPFVIHGGDFVTGYGVASKASIINDIKINREMFRSIWDRVLIIEGNHDAAYDGDAALSKYYTKNLTSEECYNYMFRHNSLQPQKVTGGNKTYYYQDDVVNKIRFILLNSSDLPYGVGGNGESLAKYNKMQRACMREEQVNWFANVALQVPDDSWSVLVCSHIEPYSADMNVQNGNMAAEILQAFKNKSTYSGTSKVTVENEFKFSTSVNFTGKGGNVIGWLSGHMHADGLNRNRPAGINFNIVETLNDSNNVWAGQPNKVAGTSTEQAFDILTINKKIKKVNLTRIGAGVDRSFNY